MPGFWIYLASFEMYDFDNELGHVETLLVSSCDLLLFAGYILPLAYDQQWMLKLAELIRLKKAEWSPMLVVFNQWLGTAFSNCFNLVMMTCVDEL